MPTAAAAPAPVDPDPEAERRATLRGAIAAQHADETRLAALEEARDRARRDGHAAYGSIESASQLLHDAEVDEPERVAYAFINAETDAPSPVETAKAALAAATAERNKFSGIEKSIEQEIASTGLRLARRRVAVDEAMAALVCNSAQFNDLLEDLDWTWSHLRGLRACFDKIARELHGRMPTEYSSRWQRGVSLDPLAYRDATGRAIETDTAPLDAWTAALEFLACDADAALPELEP